MVIENDGLKNWIIINYSKSALSRFIILINNKSLENQYVSRCNNYLLPLSRYRKQTNRITLEVNWSINNDDALTDKRDGWRRKCSSASAGCTDWCLDHKKVGLVLNENVAAPQRSTVRDVNAKMSGLWCKAAVMTFLRCLFRRHRPGRDASDINRNSTPLRPRRPHLRHHATSSLSESLGARNVGGLLLASIFVFVICHCNCTRCRFMLRMRVFLRTAIDNIYQAHLCIQLKCMSVGLLTLNIMCYIYFLNERNWNWTNYREKLQIEANVATDQ